ncbi:MAG: NHLP bacteriocin export ABC transporter permease/ATPase subunit [Alphaproteobacteria bacterium]
MSPTPPSPPFPTVPPPPGPPRPPGPTGFPASAASTAAPVPKQPPSLEILFSGGERLVSGPNEAIPLSGHGDLWLVTEGEVEVFVVRRTADGGGGLRHFLSVFSAGDLMAGFPAGDLMAGFPAGDLMAGFPAGDPDAVGEGVWFEVTAIARQATVVRMPASRMPRFFANSPTCVLVADALDVWIRKITEGIGSHLRPRMLPISALDPEATATADGTQVITTPRGVVWAERTRGEASYLGLVTVGEGVAVPLTPDSWWTVEEGGLVEAIGSTTAARLTGKDWWPQLSAFHELFLKSFARAAALAEEAEIARQRQSADKIVLKVDATLDRFTTLVTGGTLREHRHDPDDALALACAAACKPMGITISSSPLLNRARATDKPLTVEDVARVSRIRVRNIALRDDWWRQDLGSLVAFVEEDRRPVALVQKSPGRYRVQDPEKGESYPLTADFARRLSPLAYTFFAPLPDKRIGTWDFVKFGFRGQSRDIAIAMIASALGALLALALPVATASIFQSIIPSHEVHELIEIGLALVMIGAVSTIFKITGDIALLRMEGRVAGGLQAAVIDRLLKLPNSFFGSYSSGDLASRTLAVEQMRKTVTGLVLSSALAGVFSLFSFALLIHYQPIAGSIAGLLMLMLVGAAIATAFAQQKALVEGEAMSGNLVSMVLQIVSGVAKLRMAAAEDRAFVVWGHDFGEMRSRMLRVKTITNRFNVFLAGYDILSLTSMFLLVALTSKAVPDTGTFLAFIAAFTSFLNSIQQVTRAILASAMVSPMIKRVAPLLQTLPEVDTTKADPGKLTGDIEINNVFFRYDRDSPRVLNGLSLKVQSGQFVALVGPSGCGKSTLMKLLLGFERPEAGGIFFDEHDLRTLDAAAVRRQIGVVLQSGKLMAGSLYENIKGASDASVEDTWDAARMVGLEDDIRQMPMGMHTVLTEGAAALSGGQIQRLLIARALVAGPRILLFDEATSALDNRTQAVVTESLTRLAVTRIVIAHRLTTVQDADRIFVLKEGKVEEEGTYTELMGRKGLFSDLARRQLV